MGTNSSDFHSETNHSGTLFHKALVSYTNPRRPIRTYLWLLYFKLLFLELVSVILLFCGISFVVKSYSTEIQEFMEKVILSSPLFTKPLSPSGSILLGSLHKIVIAMDVLFLVIHPIQLYNIALFNTLLVYYGEPQFWNLLSYEIMPSCWILKVKPLCAYYEAKGTSRLLRSLDKGTFSLVVSEKVTETGVPVVEAVA